ncbi:MAG: tRNA (guanine(46)-N(7))-methyltransferase TrmB [Acidobacteriota bacterium]
MAAASGVREVVLDLGQIAVPFGARELFGADRPLELELGVGNALFLLAWAGAHPEIGLLGVERSRPYLELAARRVGRRGLSNVRLVRTTAEDLLFRCLAPGCASAVHVYFPDPWPKKRHHKRRLFQPASVARLAEALRPGGLLLVKTDHADYAAVIAEVLSAEPLFAALDPGEAFSGLPPSGYEAKYGPEGREIRRFACLRR